MQNIKHWNICLFATICFLYTDLGRANPLEGLRQDINKDLGERASQPQQQTQVFDFYDAESDQFFSAQKLVQPERPNFSVENSAVLYRQTLQPNNVFAEGAQSVGYKRPSINDTLADYGDAWSIGDGWLGGKFEYQVWARNDGESYAMSRFNATVLGNGNDFIRTSIRVNRDRKNTYYKVSDDKLNYTAEAYAFGDTIALEQGDVGLGSWRRTPSRWFQKTFSEHTWRYAVGPVPVRIWLRLAGRVETGSPYIEAGVVGYNDIKFDAYAEPSASLVAQGGADVFGDIPAAIRPGDVGLRAKLDFLKGRILARAQGRSNAQGPCLNVDFRDFSTLSGELTAFAYWQALQVQQVKSFVNQICNNSFFTIPGCGAVQSFISTVSSWTKFDYEKVIFQRDGFHFGATRPWLQKNTCQLTQPDTVIKLCSQFHSPIYAVLGYFDHKEEAYRSMGWYQVPANGCRDVSIGNYQGSNVYIYAEHNGGATTWSGDNGSLCAHKTEAFDFMPGDRQDCNGIYKSVSLNRFDISANTTNTWTFQYTP